MRGHDGAVVMPYTVLRQEAVDAVDHDLLTVDVGSGDTAYWELLGGLWERQQTFVLVEHDIVVHPGAIDELFACPRRWCSFETPYAQSKHMGLSCAKFEAALLRAHPDAIERIAEMSDEGHPPKHWCRLDAWLSTVLRSEDEFPHRHCGPIRHIRGNEARLTGVGVMPSHGCC